MSSLEEKNDVERGEIKKGSHAVILESPKMRWHFIRKVNSILAIQLTLAIAVSLVAILVPSVNNFLNTKSQTRIGKALLFFLTFSPLLVLLLLFFCRRKHPLNFLLLILLTFAFASGLGSSGAFSHGKMILQAIILITVVIVSLITYTFWAGKKGYDFKFLGPFLFSASFMVIVFFLIQMFSPLVKGTKTISGLVVGLVFCAYVVHDMGNLINCLSYDEYIWASARLHLDIVPVVISLLTCNKFRKWKENS